jgi:tetratricopeptide (TPR) repeat protein
VTDQTNSLILADDGKKEYEKGNYKAAAGLFSQAAQAYSSMGDELNAAELKNKRQGIAVSNRAAALEGLKKWKEALAEYDRAAAIFEQAGEGDMHSLVRKSAANINLKRLRVNDSQMDVLDSLRLVEKPTLTQRFLKFLMRIGLR